VSDLVNGLSLLEAEFVNHRYERHFHDELVLAITESGIARISCWGQWFTAGPGDIFVSNPNDPQAAITFGATWKYRAFYLTRHGLDQLAHVLDLEEHCDLDSLSIHLRLSRFQLVRLFNQRVGMPPHAFLVQLRLARACRLLRSGSSIAAAAVDSGFFDQSALTRHFRSSLGVTPRQYQYANRR
jgi:AraC-like DNA-binding protein